MLKQPPPFSPTQPRRAETRRSTGKAAERAIPKAYFRSTSKGSNDQECCRGAFSAALNRKSLRPPHYGQGRRLHALRGTTLVRQRMTSGHPSPFIGPLRERSGIHYSGFTDSAQRRVRRHTDRLAPPAGSLKSVRLAYYSSSSPYDLGSITGWSDLERGFFPTAFAINQNNRSVGPINA